MSEDVWSAQDTDPDAIEAALRELLRRRHAKNENLAPARVLNLVVILDREWKGEVANRLERMGRYHASRTVLCVVEEKRETLDATATVSYSDPSPGKIGVMHELVEIDVGPQHLDALQTVVDPVLASEMPTVLWSPHGHQDAVAGLLPVIDVLLLDSDEARDPGEAFAQATQLSSEVYVVDLAWLRTTPWRERLAASFELRGRLQTLLRTAELEISHHERSAASGLLLLGWLASRLDWDYEPLEPGDRGALRGRAKRGETEISFSLHPLDQDMPGLGGVTVRGERGASLSLQRGAGGLDAHERMLDGREFDWKILGASRGESGILGEGVRQALLRDPTYRPALHAAREMCPA